MVFIAIICSVGQTRPEGKLVESCQVAIPQACQEKGWENVQAPSGSTENCFQFPEGLLIEYHCHPLLGFFSCCVKA